ncbi:MAG: hypothetical protein WCC48_10835 [Anaeromyxobacteraceae bacterium]
MTMRVRRHHYLLAFFAAFVVVLTAIFVLAKFPNSHPWFRPLVDGYGGNLTAELVGGLLFLLLAFYLDAQTEANIAHIREVTQRSEEILAERERLLQQEKTIRQFEEFLRRESYHNVRFPELGPPPGLEYIVEPVRDSGTGEPRKYETEMATSYVVKIRGPAHWEVLSEAKRKPFEESPIRWGEYYFCQFFNDSWHMATSSLVFDGHPFYMSGKSGPVEYGESANSFVSSFDDSYRGLEKVAHLVLDLDGLPMTGSGGCETYDIFTNAEGELFLQAHDSPPKRVFLTNSRGSVDDNSWYLEVADISGHASGQKLKNIKAAIEQRLASLELKPPRVWWHEAEQR